MAQAQTTEKPTEAKLQTIADEIETLIDTMIKVHQMIQEVEREIALRIN